MDRRNRSHSSLIQPLTTYPTSPSISISASPSYLYAAHPSLPTTPSILSRNPSQSRLRPSTSSPQAANTKLRSRARKSARNSNADISTGADGEDWLTRTASTVTMIGLEERGASWLVARRSSTSLLSGENGDEDENGNEAYYSPEWRGSRSRIQSQMGSAKGSRSKLESRRGSMGVREAADGEGMGKGEGVEPDFVDVDEEDGLEEEEGEVVDEGEMRRIVKGKIGGWVDWAVGWMDFRGDDGEEEEGDEEEQEDEFGKGQGGEGDGKEALDVMELQKRLRRKKRRDEEVEDGDGSSGEPGIVTPPPQGEDVGVWSDAKWLLGVATKVVL